MKCAATAALRVEIGGLFVSSEVPGGKPDPAPKLRDEAGFRIRRLRAQDTVRMGVRILKAHASSLGMKGILPARVFPYIQNRLG